MKYIIDKLDDVYKGYKSLLKLLDAFKENRPILEALSKTWVIVHHTLITLCKVIHRDPTAPPTIKGTKKMVNMIIEELRYISSEEPKVRAKIDAFHTFNLWTIPQIIDKDKHVRDFSDWRSYFYQIVSKITSHMKEERNISIQSFNLFLDRIVTLDV